MYAIFKDELVEQAKEVYSQHSMFKMGNISLEELRNHQQARIKKIINYVVNNSPFYKEHLQEISISDVDSIADFNTVPFTTKEHLRDNAMNLLCVPIKKCWIYYETTGTTGRPTPCPRNELDSIYNNTPLIINYKSIFAENGSEHVVGVMGPTELHSTGDTFEDVMRSLGHTVVKMWPRSPVVGLKRTFELINELQITALVCTPAVAISIARYFRELGQDPSCSSVKLILTVGELISPSLLKNISKVWGANTYSSMYASQEASIMGVCSTDNCLYTIPLNNYYEIVKPFDSSSYDITEDVTGELVITHLYPGAKPLIRYRTGDMVRSVYMPDGSQRITPIGRVKDILSLNNKICYPWDLEEALLRFLPNCLDYAIQIDSDKKTGRDALNITVEMFYNSIDQSFNISSAKSHMTKIFPNVAINIAIGKTSDITSTSAMVSWKAARIHDLRSSEENRERDAALKLINRGFGNEAK